MVDLLTAKMESKVTQHLKRHIEDKIENGHCE